MMKYHDQLILWWMPKSSFDRVKVYNFLKDDLEHIGPQFGIELRVESATMIEVTVGADVGLYDISEKDELVELLQFLRHRVHFDPIQMMMPDSQTTILRRLDDEQVLHSYELSNYLNGQLPREEVMRLIMSADYLRSS